MNYGNFSRNYRNDDAPFSGPYNAREHARLGDTRNEPGEHYRVQQSKAYGQRGGNEGTREDRYSQMYDTPNYSDQPRYSDYGLPYGVENDLKEIGHFPYGEGPYAQQPRNYSYKQGYNANYDNPVEGDRYRDFNSRGNHGYRHGNGYGNEDSFREFGNDRFGSYNPY